MTAREHLAALKIDLPNADWAEVERNSDIGKHVVELWIFAQPVLELALDYQEELHANLVNQCECWFRG